jgi:hypothetical protein
MRRPVRNHWRVSLNSPLKLLLGSLVALSILLILVGKQYLDVNVARKTVTELELRLRNVEHQTKSNAEAGSTFFQRLRDDVKSLSQSVKSLDISMKQSMKLRDETRGVRTIADSAHPGVDQFGRQVATQQQQQQQPLLRGIRPAVPTVAPRPKIVRRILFPGVTVVVMFCFGRVQYLSQALNSLTTRLQEQVALQHRRNGGALSEANSFLVVLSQDGDVPGISTTLDEAAKILSLVSYVVFALPGAVCLVANLVRSQIQFMRFFRSSA